MSVSIDDDPNEVEDARAVLAGWLDDYAAGRCDREDMQASFLSICRSNSEAPWDALALLDQYQRRGKIEPDLARTLKSDIAQLVFGVATQTEAPRDTTEATLDTTGTRWRKLLAERDVPQASTDDTSDLTLVRSEPKPAPIPAPTHDVQTATADVPEPQAASARVHTPPAAERAAPRPPRSRTTRDVLRDRYELQGVLGHGNSSTVYKALDRRRAHLAVNDRFVAVKVLKRSFEDRAALAELEREFHQAQALSHPNVVSVFDLDQDGETYFIVMEMLEGELLSSVLHRLNHEPIRRSQAMNLIGAIGAALRHAHGRGVVHGDLKPANVMVTCGGEIRVLGFGFARTRATQASPNADAISTGAPAYASMERIHGEIPEPVDDVYSFACIVYELLSGRHPYGGRSAVLARAHGKRPARIEGLTNKQWRALSDALMWDKVERRIDVADLLSALGCTEAHATPLLPQQIQGGSDDISRRWGIWIALLLLGIAAAVATFLITQVPAPPSNEDEPATTTQDSAVPNDRPSAGDASSGMPQHEKSTRPEPASLAPEESNASAAAARSQPEQVPASRAMPVAPKPASQSEQVVREEAATTQMPATAHTQPERVAPPAVATAAPASAAPAASAPSANNTIEFEKDTYVATESDAAVRLVVKRSGSTRQAVKFKWSLKGNSAEAGTDFAAIGPDVEEIPAGQRTVHLTIPLVSDAIVENTELFLVELATVDDSATLGEVSHAAVIIVDDD
ncbi:MAG TPA: protein kinase [Steroidobacteraceae bacterium]|nr:protein kinase [Steroidobacteraceae bacterium]